MEVHGSNPFFALLELALLNAGLFIFFGMSLFKPVTRRDWRALKPGRAFATLMFTEYYAVPLGIYLMSGWLQPRLPGLSWLSGQLVALLGAVIGRQPDPHADPLRWAGLLLTGAGAVIVALAWRRLYPAARAGRFPDAGPYAHIRHPLHAGLVLLMAGILLLCPTLVTAAMFPVLLIMYRRSAREQEQVALARFGRFYQDYRERVPPFWPYRSKPGS